VRLPARLDVELEVGVALTDPVEQSVQLGRVYTGHLANPVPGISERCSGCCGDVACPLGERGKLTACIGSETKVITSGNSAKRAQWRADAPQPALVRFVLLSMLLHTTIVVLFGTSHGGGASRGEAMLDVLDVTFRREPGPPDAGLLAGPGAEAATGRALLQRADPQLAPAGPARSEPMPAIEPPKISEPTPSEPATPASGQTHPEAAPPAAAEPLPRIDLRAPQEVDKPLIAPVAPPTIERLAPPQNADIGSIVSDPHDRAAVPFRSARRGNGRNSVVELLRD